jgi:signal transduction histidine kinase
VLALAVVALFELLALAHGVRSQRRLRARVTDDAERRVAASRGALEAALARGRQGWDEAAGLALSLGLASEAEVLALDGSAVFSRPHVPPVVHRPSEADRRQLQGGRLVTTLARDGDSLRALTYLPMPAASASYLFRLSSPATDLEDEAREWRAVLLGHATALAALGLAGVLMLWPRGASAASSRDGALSAYEEAMGRLRDQGQELSERHELQTRRMEQRFREQEAMSRAGELTAGIVHEVRNGLGTILGYARLLERSESPEVAARARAVLDECATLEAVVRRFSDFVKLERLQIAATDLAPLVRRVLARELRRHDDVSTSLKALDAPLVVQADEELLERALENIVRNAVQAASEGGGNVEITALSSDGFVVLRVDDDGPGWEGDSPPEVRPFYTTRPGGLGLGLPLARKIVLLHGGELWLERRTARGARISIRLPEGGPGPDQLVTEGNAG